MSNKILQYQTICFLLFAFCFLLGCQPSESQMYRNVIINDVGYRIPIEYYHPLAIPKNNTEDVNALLNILMPDIYPHKASRTILYEQGMEYMDGSLMITSPFTNIKKTHKALQFENRIIRFSEVNKTSRQIDDIYGLQYLTRPEGLKMDRDEILFEGKKTDPDTILFCRPRVETRPPYPQCRMQFKHVNNIISVRFRRKEWLKDWKKIKANSLNILEQFHQDYLVQQGG